MAVFDLPSEIVGRRTTRSSSSVLALSYRKPPKLVHNIDAVVAIVAGVG